MACSSVYNIDAAYDQTEETTIMRLLRARQTQSRCCRLLCRHTVTQYCKRRPCNQSCVQRPSPHSPLHPAPPTTPRPPRQYRLGPAKRLEKLALRQGKNCSREKSIAPRPFSCKALPANLPGAPYLIRQLGPWDDSPLRAPFEPQNRRCAPLCPVKWPLLGSGHPPTERRLCGKADCSTSHILTTSLDACPCPSTQLWSTAP